MAETVRTKSGRELTAEEIEALAAEAAAGFDLAAWRPRRAGRRPLEEQGEAPSPRIAVRLPQTLYRRVTARAEREHRSVSAVVRELLERYADSA